MYDDEATEISISVKFKSGRRSLYFMPNGCEDIVVHPILREAPVTTAILLRPLSELTGYLFEFRGVHRTEETGVMLTVTTHEPESQD